MSERPAIPSDDELMRLVCSGDERAFAQVMERHRGMVFRLLHRLLSRREIAEELTQEVFMKLYGARDSYEGGDRLRAYLFQIARNVLIDYWRRVEHDATIRSDSTSAATDNPEHPASLSRDPQPSDRLHREEVAATLQRAISRLPERQQACITMFYFEVLSVVQVSQRLGINVSAMKKRLHDGRKSLHRALKEEPA